MVTMIGTGEGTVDNTGLMTHEEQLAHSEKVRTEVLTFLAEETFTTAEVIQELIDYKSIKGTNGVLKKLVKDGLVKHHRMNNLAGRGLNFWGITVPGMYAISDPDGLPKRVRGFEPSRISLSTLDHRIQTQRTKIYLRRIGWSVAKEIDLEQWDKKLPDIVTRKPGDKDAVVAIEIELTVKSRKRYANIISEYREFAGLRRVVWLTETSKVADKLRSIFESLDKTSGDLHRFMSLDEFQGKHAH